MSKPNPNSGAGNGSNGNDSTNAAPPTPDTPALTPDMSGPQMLELMESYTPNNDDVNKALDILQRDIDFALPPRMDTIRASLIVGRFTRIAGMRDIVRGQAMRLQMFAFQVVGEARQSIKRLEKMPDKNAKTISERLTLISSILKDIALANKVMLDSEGTLARLPSPADNPETPINKSFSPGQQFTPSPTGTTVIAKEVHLHQSPASPQTKEEK